MGGTQPEELAPVAWPVVGAVAAAVTAGLMMVAGRYGWHRDELYFLECGRHLAASYVDQPILTPLIARLALDWFGVSLLGLRLFPAVATGATVALTALLAREFGGGRRAQLWAALGAVIAPAVLASGHIHGPTAYDLTAWVGLSVLVARLARTRDPRLWLPIGAVVGIGLANKHSIAFLAVTLAVGLLAVGERELFTTWWFAAALAIAVGGAAPDLAWQAAHHWATIPMTRRLNQKYGGPAGLALFLPAQLVMANPAFLFVWLRGLRWLRRAPVRGWQAFVWSYGLLFVFFGLTAGKHPYYVAALYLVLIAAGTVAAEAATGPLPAARPRELVGVLVAAAIAAPIVLPIAPASAIGWTASINPVGVETVGWPDFLRAVSGVWQRLPAGEQTRAVILTGSYGESGAINELGRHYRLPHAVSGHNNVWWWGPDNPAATTVVAVVPGPAVDPDPEAYLHRYFGQVTLVAEVDNHHHLHNEEHLGRIYICQQPSQPLGQLWPNLQHYD